MQKEGKEVSSRAGADDDDAPGHLFHLTDEVVRTEMGVVMMDETYLVKVNNRKTLSGAPCFTDHEVNRFRGEAAPGDKTSLDQGDRLSRQRARRSGGTALDF